MARLIRSNGTEENVFSKGKRWTLDELQKHVGGPIEFMPGIKNLKMIFDEEARLKGKLFNIKATELVLRALNGRILRYTPQILGDVLVLDKTDKM